MITHDVIRLAKPEEASNLSHLAMRSKGHWGYDAGFLANCKEALTYTENQLLSPTSCFKVAELSPSTIAGFFALNYLHREHAELDALFIDPEYIGQGWGKRLLQDALAVAGEHGVKSIKLLSDPFAEAFYLAHGAVKVGEKESDSMAGRFLPLLELRL